MSERRVVAVLGRGLVPADTPILRADDLGALRGDGIFETIRVWGGRPWLLAEHLARLARSAARLELAVPPEATLVDLVDQACSAWPRDAEGVLRLVCTRGPEDGGEVTAYATIAPVGEAILRARAEGVRVLTATLGVPATACGPPPTGTRWKRPRRRSSGWTATCCAPCHRSAPACWPARPPGTCSTAPARSACAPTSG